MRTDIFDQVHRAYIPEELFFGNGTPSVNANDLYPNAEKEKMDNVLKTGTTIIAFMYQDGILMAADRQVSCGSNIRSTNFNKLHQINNSTWCGFAGSVADMQQCVKRLRSINDWYTDMSGFNLTTEGQANYMVNLYRSVRYYPLMAWMILGGASVLNGNVVFRIFEVSPDGCKLEENYATTGSGAIYVRPKLKERSVQINSRAMNLSEAVKFALDMIATAASEDTYTSHPRMALPTIICITGLGTLELPEVAIKAIINESVADKPVPQKEGENGSS